ncbi:YcaO-like family protein [Acrocarpospora catenulata]|uniref:YcaO-like family protein n=1 Tax=Acrocarpospora catenulata TaxID=2836182 RepID=UPI001BD943EC|nr:YcaO-like family protein [Acrocarpospora catenulata]
MHQNLIDSRTGIVRRLETAPIPPQLPASFSLVTAVLADTTRFGPWPSDSAGAGYAFADPDAARAAALGEAAERYCGNLVPPGLRTAAFAELDRPALDPADLALYSAEQYERIPLHPFTRDLPVEWTEATDLVTGQAVLVPAGLVWVSYFSADVTPPSPRTNPVIQAGLAAGPDLAYAAWGALCEIVERDAMTLAWHGRAGLRAVEPPPWLAAFARGPLDRLDTRFLSFPTTTGLQVIGALVRDLGTGYLTLGMGVRAEQVGAMLKAYGEALQLQLFVAGLDDPDGPYCRAAADPRSPLKPWRPGRDYGSAYRDDLADVVDYGCHLQLFLDPAVQERFEAELAEALTEGGDPPRVPPPRDLAELASRVARPAQSPGPQVLLADLTTPDVASAGLRVVRLIAPGTYANTAAGLPFLGGTRLAASLAGRPRRALPLPH